MLKSKKVIFNVSYKIIRSQSGKKYSWLHNTGIGSVADPYPGLGAFLTPGSGMGESQHPDPGSGMNNPETIFWLFLGLKYLNSLMRIWDPGSRIEKVGSGINIPDPPHWE